MSDLRIDCEGTWFYREMEMSRRDIVRLFYQNLRQDASGVFAVEIRGQRYLVDVEDTAYVVWGAYRRKDEGIGEDCLRLLLSDDSLEELNPATLRIGKHNIPYCRVKDGRFEARFSRSGYYELAEHIGYDDGRGGFFIDVRGQRYSVPVEEDE